MTSKKSSADAFRFTFFNTTKKNCVIPILILCYNLFYQLYTPVSYYYNEKLSGSFGLGLDKTVYAFTNPANDFFGVIFTALMLAGPFVLAALIFRYMMNKSAVNVYYSLGVKRSTMFFSKFTAGCTMVIIAQIIPLAIALLTNILLFGSTAELWRTFLFMLLHYIVLEIYVFAVTAAVFSIVGTVIEGLVFSALYAVSPAVIAAYIEFLFQYFLVGSVDNGSSWSYTTGNYQILGWGTIKSSRIDLVNSVGDFLLFPYSSDVRVRYRLTEGPYSWNNLDYRTLIFWTVITAVIVFLGWAAYKNRKVEIAGFMGSNQKATFAGVFIASTFLSSVLLPAMMSTETNFEKVMHLVFSALIFLIVYVVIEAISLRSVKKLFRYFWKYPLHVAIYSLGIIIFATGFFGYKTRIPAIEKIESVSIQTGTGDMMISPTNVDDIRHHYYDEKLYFPAIFSADMERDYRLVGGFDSAEDIQRAIDIHQKLIDCSGDTVNGETVGKPYGERVRPVSLTIVYHLKNGKNFQRHYNVANDEILCELAEFTLSDHYKNLALKAITGKQEILYSENVPDVDLYDPSSPFMTVYSDMYQVGFASPNFTRITTPADIQYKYNLKDDILQAIGKDIEAGNLSLDFRNESKLLGYVVFKNFKNIQMEYEYTDESYIYEINSAPSVDAEVIYVDDKVVLEEEGCFSAVSTDGFTVPVYENMTNTVNLINSSGYAEFFVNAKTPYAVKIWDGVTEIDESSFYNFSNKTMLFNGVHYYPVVDDSYGTPIEMPEKAQTIAQNPELIAEYESKARMVYLNCYDGVYAQFLFEDGSSTFGFIPS